jgi:hypothetical protein
MTEQVPSEKQCTCVSCGACDGSGSVWYSFSGEYLGNSRCDDLDDLQTCDECNGSGLSEVCDLCQDWREEQMEEYQ